MVEHRTFNPLVIGSIPILPTNTFGIRLKAGRQTLNLPMGVRISHPEPICQARYAVGA